MFSDPDYKNSTISVYKYSLEMEDGSIKSLSRSFSLGFGSSEWNISKLVKKGDLTSLQHLFSQWAKIQPNKEQIKKIVVTQINAYRPTKENHTLKITEKKILDIYLKGTQ